MYSTYQASCTSVQLCDPSIGLTCPTTASGCNCPTTSTANKCDCPTTHYWDQSSCVARVSENDNCDYDYMCKKKFFYLYIYFLHYSRFEILNYKWKL